MHCELTIGSREHRAENLRLQIVSLDRSAESETREEFVDVVEDIVPLPEHFESDAEENILPRNL